MGRGPAYSADSAGDGPVRRTRVRDLKRGAGAWDAVAQAELPLGLRELSTTLLAHSVADSTALHRYFPMVRAWHDFIEEKQLHCCSWEERDVALVAFMAYRCYVEDRGPTEGSFLLNGLGMLYPGQALPRAWQALKAWQRGFVEHLGGPVGLEALACMEFELRSQPDVRGQCAGDMLPVAVDGYLRKQDLRQLRVEDCVFFEGEVVLRLGRSDRGESVKTGRDQTVRLDFPHSAAIVRARCKGRPSSARVFDITSEEYNRWWSWAASRCGVHRPPHSVRHTGAARDLATGYRTQEQVKRRGRWLADKSVARYARTGDWVAACAAQGAAIVQRGRQLLAQRAPRPDVPRE